eukprot:730087-Rhodomonas_salina.1
MSVFTLVYILEYLRFRWYPRPGTRVPGTRVPGYLVRGYPGCLGMLGSPTSRVPMYAGTYGPAPLGVHGAWQGLLIRDSKQLLLQGYEFLGIPTAARNSDL